MKKLLLLSLFSFFVSSQAELLRIKKSKTGPDSRAFRSLEAIGFGRKTLKEKTLSEDDGRRVLAVCLDDKILDYYVRPDGKSFENLIDFGPDFYAIYENEKSRIEFWWFLVSKGTGRTEEKFLQGRSVQVEIGGSVWGAITNVWGEIKSDEVEFVVPTTNFK